jgi:hypothetical protein
MNIKPEDVKKGMCVVYRDYIALVFNVTQKDAIYATSGTIHFVYVLDNKLYSDFFALDPDDEFYQEKIKTIDNASDIKKTYLRVVFTMHTIRKEFHKEHLIDFLKKVHI